MVSYRTKAIISVVVVILTISGCYLSFFINQQSQHQTLLIESKKDLVSTLVTTLAGQIDKQYRSRIKSFVAIQNKQIQAFLNRDREALYSSTLAPFEVLHKENKYFDHLNFILPDNTVFLRMHEPENYGDVEKHFSAHDSENNIMDHRFSGGFVYGDCGLYYQVSNPIYSEGKYAGAILFGIRIDAFIEEIRNNLGMHTALLLDQKRQEDHGYYEQGDNHYHEYDNDTCTYILKHQNDPFFLQMGSKFTDIDAELQIDFEGSVLNIFPSYVIRDIHGVELGKILQALDVTSITKSFRHDLYRLTLITLVVIVVATVILFLSFNKLLEQLIHLNETLNQKNDELEETGRKLEYLVAERTSKLEETNKKLQDEIVRRQDANRYLSRSVEEWQSTFDAITDPVTILDNDLEVVIANKASHDLLSNGQQETIGRKCHELFSGRSSVCPDCPAQEVFKKGEQQEGEIEHVYLGKSLLVSCAPNSRWRGNNGFCPYCQRYNPGKGTEKTAFSSSKNGGDSYSCRWYCP